LKGIQTFKRRVVLKERINIKNKASKIDLKIKSASLLLHSQEAVPD